MEEFKILDGPVKKSTESVFNTLNKKTEALDILKKYQNANEEFVKGCVEHVQILGMPEPVKLSEIYSTTRISTTIHRRLYSTEWADLSSKEDINNTARNKSTQRADQYIEKHNRVVILAGPGSGKTTLLKYTALSYIDQDVFEKSGLKTKKIPFYVSLPTLLNTELNIEEYLAKNIKIKTHEYADFYVKRLLDKGRAAVMLDSLDEVPLAQRDRAYDLIEEFSKLYPKAKILLTCRVADYDRTLEGFYEVEISRLTETAINKIIRAWFKGRPKKAKELINHLSVDKDVYSLTETPLLLSLLCIQYSNDLNIPNRKTELYSRCIDALLRSWDTSRGFRRDSAFSTLTDDRKEKLFSEVAYNFLCTEQAKYIFPQDQLLTEISNYIERFGISSDLAPEILNEIESHHGILEKYTAESFGFSHVSFQEYFVARAIVAKRVELQFVKNNITNSRAASIIIFMVSLMDDPSCVLQLLMDKSNIKGISTYPAMNKRTEILSLLYRCMNSGVAISLEFRKSIYKHIADSHLEMAKIYKDAKTFPIAKLEDDGISHTFFYVERTRKTLGSALMAYRKLSNEILLSPSRSYADAAVELVDSLPDQNNSIMELCIKSCILVPISGANPDAVKSRLQVLNDKLEGTFQKITTRSLEKLEKNYLEKS